MAIRLTLLYLMLRKPSSTLPSGGPSPKLHEEGNFYVCFLNSLSKINVGGTIIKEGDRIWKLSLKLPGIL